ncbi:MAG: DUF4214 domain-containing protein, partial [Candidatus Competibacteraceae bacterium]|nr:DUF4214 domain-containing protein [Candidatus Competibacteraceae bacterium]
LSATPTPLMPGEELTYTLTFSNSGTQALNDADLTLRLPTGVTVLNNGGGTLLGNNIIWSIDQLNSGTSDRRQVQVQDSINDVSHVLYAQAEIDDKVGVAGPDVRASLLTPFRNNRPLELALTVSDDPLVRGQGFFYHLTVANTNPTSGAPMENVRIWGMVPQLAAFGPGRITGASASGCDRYDGCYYGHILTLSVGTLLPGESREIQIPVWTKNDASFGHLVPIRFFGSYDADPLIEPVIVADTIAIEQFKTLDINLSANPAPIMPSGQLIYELLYGNTDFAAANGSLELTLPDQVQVLDSDGGIQTGNIIVWDNIGPLGSGRGSRRQVVVEDTRGLEGRLLQAEARLVNDASFKSWAARSALSVSARTVVPLSMTAALSKDPLAQGDDFRYELMVTNTNPISGASLENVRIQWMVPNELKAFGPGSITGASASGCDRYDGCYYGHIVTLTIGTLDPGESREVYIPVTVKDDLIPGILFETHFIGNANFPNGVNIQQLTATVGALIGEYAVTVPTHALTVTTTGTGTGTVSSNPAGINCGSDCSQSYPEGASVTLTANPDSNSTFAGWSGACSGSGTCVVTMDAAKNVTATFALENSDPATTLITHYYVSILEREPEEEGLAFWKDQIAEKQANGEDVKPVFRAMAAFFFFSEEYIGRNTTNIQFLTNLYLTFFQREPDDEGLEFWLVQLVGGMSRNQAMQGFLFSPEFTSFMEELGF